MKVYKNQQTQEHIELVGFLSGVDPINLKELNGPNMWVSFRPLGADYLKVMPKKQFDETCIEIEPKSEAVKAIATKIQESLSIDFYVKAYTWNDTIQSAFIFYVNPNQEIGIIDLKNNLENGIIKDIAQDKWAEILGNFSVIFEFNGWVKIRYNFTTLDEAYDHEENIKVRVVKQNKA